MRAAAILGLGCSPKNLKPFQNDSSVEWRMGLPATSHAADIVLIFGGDGTIHRHLGQLVELGLPVLVVPAGSGNDFARALGLRRVQDSLTAWLQFVRGRGTIHDIDLGVISATGKAGEAPAPHSSRYFCSVAGIGLDSEVARRANGLPRWLRGNGGYVLSLLPAVLKFAPLRMKIFTCPDDTSSDAWTICSDRPTLLAAFANTTTYGGGMKIAPQAKMSDGLLDICVVAGLDPFKLFCLFPTVYSGKHLGLKEVDYFQAPRVRVETEYPLDVYADGEFVCQTPIEIGVESAALRVVG
jgi:diacylglycerol kinase (ATP)